MANLKINTSTQSISTDLESVGSVALDENERESDVIEKYKKRLILKESLLSSFTYNTNTDNYYHYNNRPQSSSIKNMPAYMYVYKNQYILFPNSEEKQDLERCYDEIFLLNDINLPETFFLQKKQEEYASLEKSCSSPKILVNLVSPESVQKHIYEKIVECNKPKQHQQQQQIRNQQQGNSPLKIANSYNKHILKSQFCIAVKLLLSQYKQTSICMLVNIIIGLGVTISSFFVFGYESIVDDSKTLSTFNIIISLYYLIVFLILILFLFKSTARSNALAVRYNKYLSYCFLLLSIINFSLSFFIGQQDKLQIVSIFGTAFILIFIFHTSQSIKLANLYKRLEVLLGIKTKDHLKM